MSQTKPRMPYCPTPDEIAERARAIRDATPAKVQKRRMGAESPVETRRFWSGVRNGVKIWGD